MPYKNNYYNYTEIDIKLSDVYIHYSTSGMAIRMLSPDNFSEEIIALEVIAEARKKSEIGSYKFLHQTSTGFPKCARSG